MPRSSNMPPVMLLGAGMGGDMPTRAISRSENACENRQLRLAAHHLSRWGLQGCQGRYGLLTLPAGPRLLQPAPSCARALHSPYTTHANINPTAPPSTLEGAPITGTARVRPHTKYRLLQPATAKSALMTDRPCSATNPCYCHSYCRHTKGGLAGGPLAQPLVFATATATACTHILAGGAEGERSGEDDGVVHAAAHFAFG